MTRWWEGEDCAEDTCIEASYYNSVIDKTIEAWVCVYGDSSACPVSSADYVTTDDQPCAEHITKISSALQNMLDEHGSCSCDTSDLWCSGYTDPVSGDPCCKCDLECLYDAMECIVANCCELQEDKYYCVARSSGTYTCCSAIEEAMIDPFPYAPAGTELQCVPGSAFAAYDNQCYYNGSTWLYADRIAGPYNTSAECEAAMCCQTRYTYRIYHVETYGAITTIWRNSLRVNYTKNGASCTVPSTGGYDTENRNKIGQLYTLDAKWICDEFYEYQVHDRAYSAGQYAYPAIIPDSVDVRVRVIYDDTHTCPADDGVRFTHSAGGLVKFRLEIWSYEYCKDGSSTAPVFVTSGDGEVTSTASLYNRLVVNIGF